jgi:GNAT superfamily N-acetyltransferase
MAQDAPAGLTIHVMEPSDLDQVIEWAAAEGWNPGLKDAGCFLAADPDGFLIGRLHDVPVAAISVVRYGAVFGFLGLYLVRPDQRGRGLGYRLWQAGMAHLERRTVGLDGVVAQQANYARSGFVPAHRNLRYGGIPQVAAPRDKRLKTVGSDLLEAVLAYDRPFFPALREAFLRRWLEPDTRTAIAYVEDGTVRGYGVIRACRSGYRVGPLFADGEREAEMLFQELTAQAKGCAVFLDLPEPNRSAQRLAIDHGMSPVFETARMYRGERPDLPLTRTFGISTLELG